LDETISDPRIIENALEMKLSGIIHPGVEASPSKEPIRGAIMDSGLLVMATGRGQRKL